MYNMLDNYFSVWPINCAQSDARWPMKWKKKEEKINEGKNIRFKNIVWNYFLQDRFYPNVEFYGWKQHGKNNYLTDIKAREDFS